MGDETERIIGITDTPSDKDSLGIESYVKGVSDFISKTTTPLSISIQGDWGSGKTSLLKGIEEILKQNQNVKIIWFNAWEESQFNMSNQLGLAFFKKIILKIGNKNEKTKNKVLDMVKLCAIGGVNILSSHFLGGKIVEEKSANDVMKNEENRDFETLKNELKALIYEELEIRQETNNNEKRLVVFIDDLDRLEPIKAVELMEIIKNFLDIEHCVFVYAIDFNIVQMGVKSKFSGLDEDKGRKFFEKIIQVPFKMPTDKYDVGKYVKDKLMNTDIKKYFNSANMDNIIKILKQSVGYNPRAILRIFNQMDLYTCIHKNKYNSADKQLMLLSILCMQNEFESLYDKLIDNISNVENSVQYLIDFKNNVETPDSVLYSVYENEKDNSFQYLKLVLELIDNNQIQDFINILNDSTATRIDRKNQEYDENKSHYELVKKCVIQEIEKYKQAGKFLSVGTSKSKNIFTTKTLNDLFVDDKFKNDSIDFGSLCGYYIGTYGLTKNSWNRLTLSIGIKDNKRNAEQLKLLLQTCATLKYDNEFRNIMNKATEIGLVISINKDEVIGKVSKNILTIRFDDDTDNENQLINNINNAFDFILSFEDKVIKQLIK